MSSNRDFFKDSTAQLRTYEINGDLWVSVEDVLNILDLTEADLRTLRDEMPEDFDTVNDGIEVIKEGGFYYLMLFVSTTPDAKEFANWVFGSVVPRVLINGSYTIGEEDCDE